MNKFSSIEVNWKISLPLLCFTGDWRKRRTMISRTMQPFDLPFVWQTFIITACSLFLRMDVFPSRHIALPVIPSLSCCCSNALRNFSGKFHYRNCLWVPLSHPSRTDDNYSELICIFLASPPLPQSSQLLAALLHWTLFIQLNRRDSWIQSFSKQTNICE